MRPTTVRDMLSAHHAGKKQVPLRAYFILNGYFHGIQAGIQASHAMAAMFTKYNPGSIEYGALRHYVETDNTVILKFGGYGQSRLEEFYSIFEEEAKGLEFPYARFHESQEAANGTLSCVGAILPAITDPIVAAATGWGFITSVFDLRHQT